MKSKWNEKAAVDKLLLVFRMLLSVACMVCASLQIFDVADTIHIAVPLLSVLILIQSVQEHRENKKVSAIVGYVCFIAMVVMIIGALFI